MSVSHAAGGIAVSPPAARLARRERLLLFLQQTVLEPEAKHQSRVFVFQQIAHHGAEQARQLLLIARRQKDPEHARVVLGPPAATVRGFPLSA